MSKVQVDRQVRPVGESYDRLIDAVADDTRRALLRAVRARDEPADVAELAAHVRAANAGPAADGDAQEDPLPRLYHVHLPALEAAGLVEWDEAAETVAAAALPADVERWVERTLDAEAENWSAVLDALRHRRRRIALGVLASVGECDPDDLAGRVAAREAGADPIEVAESDRRSVLISLHHTHLPALAEAGLIEREEEAVRYVGHPELDPDWLPY